MVAETTIQVFVEAITAEAVLARFHPGLPEESDSIWVPLSLLDDPTVIYDTDADGNALIVIKKWFLKKHDISYESEVIDTYDKWKG